MMNKAHKSEHQYEGQKNIKTAFLLNASFALLEVVAGLLTNSLAIFSDALHDFGDALSLGVAWFFEKHATKGPDHRYTYGYARFSLLGAFITATVLIIGSIFIVIQAVPRILKPETVVPEGMLAVAVLGIIFNGIAVLRMRKGQSINEKMVSWHLLEDMFGAVALLVVSGILLIWEVPIIDPLLSLAITIFILFNVAKNIKEIISIFLQAVPDTYSVDMIEKQLIDKADIEAVYHTHIWSLDGRRHMMSTHIVMPDNVPKDKIIEAKQRINIIAQEVGIEHVTVQVDFQSEIKVNDRHRNEEGEEETR